MKTETVRSVRKRALPTQFACEADRAFTAVAMTGVAFFVGYAINRAHGSYTRWAVVWLSVALITALAGIVAPPYPSLETICRRALPILLALAIVIEAFLFIREAGFGRSASLAAAAIAFLGLAHFLPLRRVHVALTFLMAAAFFFACAHSFASLRSPPIDVFTMQTTASWALEHGLNPYSFRYPSIYPPGTPFYGPGVVDSHGMLTVGFPYPPLSLLMILPAHLLIGDIRYAQAAAVGLSTMLMAAVRPGRVGALAGAVLLLTPQALYVLDSAWTEPLLILTFSLTVFCACRWPKALPWCLGLFLSTKQYAVLALPLLPLLLEGPRRWKSLMDILFKAALVVAAINLPFFLWHPGAFVRSIVVYQFIQPFRDDALTYLTFIYKHVHGVKLPAWISLLPTGAAIAISLRRCSRSPSGFAAGITFTSLVFFAFNKQGFANYYYFVIAAACWSIAAAKFRSPECAKPVI